MSPMLFRSFIADYFIRSGIDLAPLAQAMISAEKMFCEQHLISSYVNAYW